MRCCFLFSILTFFLIETSADIGTATYYDPPYVPSACYGYRNDGVMVAGASNSFWNNRGACGSSYRVGCIGAANELPHPCKSGEVVVKIVDHCSPPFCNGTINLSRDAFARIAVLKAGKIRVSFNRV